MLRLILVATLLAGSLAAQQKERQASTPEQRATFLRLVGSLEREPLAADAKDKRAAALTWLIEVPDISVTVCSTYAPSMVGSKKELASELFFHMSLASAAFIIRLPEFKDELDYVDLSGIEGALRAYQNAKQVNPKISFPEFDKLQQQRQSGELLSLADDLASKCHSGYKKPPFPLTDKVKAGNARHQRGNSLFDNGYYLPALAEYKVLVEMFPSSSTGYLEAGQTYYQLGNIAKGEELLRQALKVEPNCVVCLVGMGNLVDDAGRPGEALTYYQRASELEPQNDKLHFNIGVTLTRLRRYGEAEEALQKALAITPTYASPYLTLAQVKREQKQLYAAEAAYRNFLNLEREGARADRVNQLLGAKVLVDPVLKGELTFDAYAQYGVTRADWIKTKFRRIYPEKEQYVRTAEEEADALAQQAAKWRETRKKNPKAADPELDRLLAIEDAGHLSLFAALTVEAYTDTQTRLAFEKWCADTKTSCKPIAQRATVEWMSQKF